MAQNTIPKLRRQKIKNRDDLAFVELAGQRHYLGVYGSNESRETYGRMIAEWTANGGRQPVDQNLITIVELLAEFWKYAEGYYVNPNVDATSELSCFKHAIKPLKTLYAKTPAKDFGPIALKATRQQMIDNGWSRKYINRQVFRIKRIFKWASSEELIPASVFHRLETVESLKLGRTEAPDHDRILPVESSVVDTTLPFLTSTVRAMVDVHRLTGMRPGELCRMRMADLNMSGSIWVYSPEFHKTQYRGRSRKIYIGVKAQEILRPFLRNSLKGYIFSPEQSTADRRERMTAERTTPLSRGNIPGSNCKSKPKRQPGKRFGPDAYNRAISRACRKAFPAPKGTKGEALTQWHRDHRWTPNQLRHTFATEIRKTCGLEAAQVLLGHAQADVTQVYAERDEQKAVEAIRKIG